MTMPATTHDTPVLIAGGGPVGLALAVELGLRGVECLVVEPRPQPTRLRPRAKTLSVRTMEHARRWGLAGRLRAAAPLPVSWSRDVSFCTSFLGEEITRFTGVLGLGDDGHSPERGQQMPQYVLEEVLRDVVTELPAVDLRLGWRLQALDGTGPGPVLVTLCDSAGKAFPVAAEYVVGADGARSVVREQIGARYVGSTALRPNTGVVFRSQELVAAVPHRPAVQTWLLNRQTPGMMGPIDSRGLWWLIAFGVDGRSADFDPQRLINGALGRELTVEVVSTDPWTARMELVDRCRSGRVFLIGDAAHLNPPFGGHGLNTGIGDAVDLGWKLAAA
ncbi:MAG TPA: FAD-dependent monooxygenase, partial [Trebonia sp.]